MRVNSQVHLQLIEELPKGDPDVYETCLKRMDCPYDLTHPEMSAEQIKSSIRGRGMTETYSLALSSLVCAESNYELQKLVGSGTSIAETKTMYREQLWKWH